MWAPISLSLVSSLCSKVIFGRWLCALCALVLPWHLPASVDASRCMSIKSHRRQPTALIEPGALFKAAQTSTFWASHRAPQLNTMHTTTLATMTPKIARLKSVETCRLRSHLPHLDFARTGISGTFCICLHIVGEFIHLDATERSVLMAKLWEWRRRKRW